MGRSLFQPPTKYELNALASLLASEDAMLPSHYFPFTETSDRYETENNCTVKKQPRGCNDVGIDNSDPNWVKHAPTSVKNMHDMHFELSSVLLNVDVEDMAWKELKSPSSATRRHHFDPDENRMLEWSDHKKLPSLSTSPSVEQNLSLADSFKSFTLSHSYSPAA